MATRTKKPQLNEFVDDDNQSSVPDASGDAGTNARPADQTGNVAPMETIDPRMAYMQGALNILRGLSNDQLAKMVADMMPYNNPGSLPAGGSPGASTPNMATLSPGADTSGMGSTPMPRLGEGVVSEADLKSLFESSGMSPEFQESARIVFETAIAEKALILETSINESYQKKFDSAVEKLEEELKVTIDELMDGVDAYLQLVVEKWLNENEIAIESGIKAKIGESVLSGLKSLAEDHSITIKETSADVVADLTSQINDLTKRYNESVESTIAMKTENANFKKVAIVEELSATLPKTQVEKLKSMVEDVEFKDESSFRKHVVVLKETFIAGKPLNTSGKPTAEEVLNEQFDGGETVVADVRMNSYINTMSKIIRTSSTQCQKSFVDK